MSANKNKPLFVINDDDDNNYSEDPTVIRAQENLALAEKVQWEQVKQQQIERAQHWVEIEVEKLQRKIEEAEKEWKRLEETELKRLEGVKRQLEEEKRVEQQHAAALQGQRGQQSGTSGIAA